MKDSHITLTTLRQPLDRTNLLYYLGLTLLVVAGFWVRLARIDLPMRYDEAFTSIRFILQKRWFYYDEPNNHILNTLMMQLCVWISGFTSASLRMPAFLSGLCLIPATAWCAKVLSNSRLAGLVAAGFVATSTILVEYSTNARGYSLVCLSAMVMIALSVKLVKNPRDLWLWIGWGAIGVIGLYTIPVMLPAVILSALLVLILGRGKNFGLLAFRLAVALFFSALVTVTLYLPVAHASGWGAILSNRWLRPEPIEHLPVNLAKLFSDFVEIAITDCSPLGIALLILGLAGVGVGRLQKKSHLWLPLGIGFLLMLFFPIVQRRVPPVRADLYVLPLLFAVSAGGLMYWCDTFRKLASRKVIAGVLLSLAVVSWIAGAWEESRREYLNLLEPWECVDAESVVAYAAENHLTSPPNVSIPSHSVIATFIYYSLLNPDMPRTPQMVITDPRCELVWLFLWKEDHVGEFFAKIPNLSALYNPPKWVRTFPSTSVYVCRRKDTTLKHDNTSMAPVIAE